MEVIDRTIMKSRHIIIPKILKTQVLDHIGIKNPNFCHVNLYTGLI